MNELKKLDNETEEQYLWKIGQLVDSGKIESWASINDIVNKELGIDEEKMRDESSFRKRYQAAKKFYDGCFSKMESEEYQKKLDIMNRELARNTIKFRDQRRSWNKQNFMDSRFDEVMDIIEERLDDFAKVDFAPHPSPVVDGEDSMIICLSSNINFAVPLISPVPSKLCPQIVRGVLSLVADATLESVNANSCQSLTLLPESVL
jgi:hypothetical protein